jgi:hypothetical protein
MKAKAVKPKAVRRPVGPMTVTLVLPGLTSKPGELGDPTIERAHRRMVDHMAKAKVHLGVGVLEVCLIEHVNGRYPTAWGWHMHGVACTRNPVALSKRLSKAFPTSDAVPRPVRVVPWDGKISWLRYCHKLDDRCRVGVDDQPHFDVRKQQPRISRGTKVRSLNPNERLELLLFHDQISLDSRIVVKGAQLRSTKNGCRIVKLRRPRR